MIIHILIDYKNRFETKFTASPYRSGMDKELLKNSFADFGFDVRYLSFSEINFREADLKGKIFLYTSSEDNDNNYKSYIEDIIFGLKTAGAVIIPDYIYLKAHDNKLFMEILRDLTGNNDIKTIRTSYFGSVEELLRHKGHFKNGSFVVKPSKGSMSKGVAAASGFSKILKHSKKISRSLFILGETKDIVRKIKYPGYIPESKYRKKFIVQNMIPDLSGDWKVLVYGDKYYTLRRENRKNDFRASGSGLLSYNRNLPEGLLDFAKIVFDTFNIPNISLDIGYDGKDFVLLEFQALFFGTYTIEHSEFCFERIEDKWQIKEERSVLEKEYARSISSFINNVILK